jgi:hypothetical protein
MSRRVTDADVAGKPAIRRVLMHDLLTPASYRRYRWRFMRLHYQFVMANERRAAYDYFMLACGPVSCLAMVRLGRGPDELFGPDGEFLAAPEMVG